MKCWSCLYAIVLCAIALGSLGCQPEATPTFHPSKEVLALGGDAESSEERQIWQELREGISEELTKRCGTPMRPAGLSDSEVDLTQLRRGAAVYARRCESCHGVSGDGDGPVAKWLNPRPRDYRRGIFKFTSMPYGARPRRADLLRTVRRGVTGTSMPSFSELQPDDLEAVVDYVLVLTHRGELEHALAVLADEEEELDPEYVEEEVENIVDRWQPSPNRIVMPITPMPPMTEESIAEGHRLFLKQACNKCHGKDGRGGLAGNIDVGKDDWGHQAPAADLTTGMFRGGERPLDIYRRIYAGINGTPMPGFAKVFKEDPDAIWRLVHFVLDSGQRRRRNLVPLDAEAIEAIERELAAEETPTSEEPTADETRGQPERDQPEKGAGADDA